MKLRLVLVRTVGASVIAAVLFSGCGQPERAISASDAGTPDLRDAATSMLALQGFDYEATVEQHGGFGRSILTHAGELAAPDTLHIVASEGGGAPMELYFFGRAMYQQVASGGPFRRRDLPAPPVGTNPRDLLAAIASGGSVDSASGNSVTFALPNQDAANLFKAEDGGLETFRGEAILDNGLITTLSVEARTRHDHAMMKFTITFSELNDANVILPPTNLVMA